MLGMSGMPLTTGFIGKFQVFSSAWDAGFEWLVIVGLIASVAAFFFYLRLVVVMYFHNDDELDGEAVEPASTIRWVLVASAAATVVFGLFPGPILDLVSNALPA